jgi:di/tricarboxylate transporter
MVAVRVDGGSPLVGRSIEAAGLRRLPGLFLVEIHREDDVLTAVAPETRLEAGDQLLFAGVVDSVVDLLKLRGLVPATDQLDKLLAPRPDRRLVEAVVAARSTFAGMSIRELRFRTKYDAAVIAVHRGGEHLKAKVGDIVLRPGDVLLLETHPSFLEANRNDRDFALFHEVANSAPPRHDRAWIALTVMAAMIAVSAAGVVPLVTAAFLAVAVLLATRCLTTRVAFQSMEGRVLLTIAASFALGSALSKTGLAAAFASGLVEVAEPLGPAGVVLGIYVATALLTEVITNNSAAALMFPLVIETATASNLPPKPLLIVLMVAASASFSTPIGYQTNLMVYGPGRYRFTDFLRIGVPLQVLVGAVTVTVATTLWF